MLWLRVLPANPRLFGVQLPHLQQVPPEELLAGRPALAHTGLGGKRNRMVRFAGQNTLLLHHL
jgi:hypothetical protein